MKIIWREERNLCEVFPGRPAGWPAMPAAGNKRHRWAMMTMPALKISTVRFHF
jgi:hypothetical protein